MAVAGGVEILSRRVFKALDEQCSRDEEILFCLRGKFSQALVALPSRLLVIKPGFMAGVTFGRRITTFLYADITGIEINTGFGTGVIEISTPSYPATAEKDWNFGTMFRNNDRNPMRVSNCLPFWTVNLKHYQPYLERLRRLIAQAKRKSGNSDSGNKTLVDQLKQLADLRHAGALTAEEFELAKKKILGAD
jgi:Short C-terminal domain